MATNQILTPSMITLEALAVLKNTCVMSNLVNRTYDSRFGRDGMKIGDTLSVRKPPRYIGRSGAGINPEGIIQTSVPIVIDQQYGVDLEIGDKELTLSIERFSEDILGPAVAKIANKVDLDVLALAPQIPTFAGTPGTIPSTSDTYLAAQTNLDNQAAPDDDRRFVVISPRMNQKIVGGLQGLFNDQATIADQYKRGRMGKGQALGFNWYRDQNVYMQQIGTYAGTPLSNGVTQTGTSIITDGWSSGLLSAKKGDIVSFAGSYAVNPQSYQSTGDLAQFALAQDVVDSSGAATLVLAGDGVVASGPFQNVTQPVADNSAVYVYSVTGNTALTALPTSPVPQALAFHRDAIALVMVDMPLPKGMDMVGRMADDETGLSIRFIRGYDIRADQFVTRLDVLYGVALLRPELATRITG